MTEVLLSIGIVVVGAGFAIWYLRRSEKQREADRQEREAQEREDLALASGLPADERPLWDPSDPDPLARAILDDGLAHNSKHVETEFRKVWWAQMDAGRGMAVAFREAMRARRWRSGSQGQVFDRLLSHGLLSEGDRDRWKREAEAEFASGYGVGG